MQDTLTLKQALEQGYTHYTTTPDEWGMACELRNLIFEEEECEHLYLCERKANFPSITKEVIAGLIADKICEDDNDVCCRDSDEVYNAVKEIDFSDIQKTINDKLKQFKYWMFTDIQVVPNKDPE